MSAERYTYEILTEIESGHSVSQRSLATRLGIALGLANLLVRRTVTKGWVRMVQVRPNRVRYLLTPSGLAEKARVSQVMLQDSIRYYATIRDRVRQRLCEIDQTWNASRGESKRVVFWGTTQVAEIACICLPETSLQLTAIIGDAQQFLGMRVARPAEVSGVQVGAAAFDCVIVTSFDRLDAARTQIEARQVPISFVEWL